MTFIQLTFLTGKLPKMLASFDAVFSAEIVVLSSPVTHKEGLLLI